MKSNVLRVVVLSIVFLFLLQMAGTLVESIYILDLLNTSLDEKALGLLFFFSPLVLFLFRGKFPRWLLPSTLLVLALSRGVTPYLPTAGRMVASGIGTGTALILIILLFNKTKSEESFLPGLRISTGVALAIALSVLLRAAGFGLDYSLTISGSWTSGARRDGCWCFCCWLVIGPCARRKNPPAPLWISPALLG